VSVLNVRRISVRSSAAASCRCVNAFGLSPNARPPSLTRSPQYLRAARHRLAHTLAAESDHRRPHLGQPNTASELAACTTVDEVRDLLFHLDQHRKIPALAPAQIRKALDDGVRVVDARSVDDFAAGHLWARSTSARPKAAGLHVDRAACSRQSFAVIDAAAQHARHEAEVGGYVAAEAAAPVLDAGRAVVAALIGTNGSDVVFTTGSTHALDLLLGSWPGSCTVACLPGEYGPNLAIMAAHGFDVRALPADGDGRLVVDEAAAVLSADPPALVHLTAPVTAAWSSRPRPSPRCAAALACRW
jgi:DNA-binding transcriptional MocR family regulator